MQSSGTGVYYQAIPAVGPDGKNLMTLIPVKKVNGQFVHTQLIPAKPGHQPACSAPVSLSQNGYPTVKPIADGRFILQTPLVNPVFTSVSTGCQKVAPLSTNAINEVHTPLALQKKTQHNLQAVGQVDKVVTVVKNAQVTSAVKFPGFTGGHYLQIPHNATVRTLPATALPVSVKNRVCNTASSAVKDLPMVVYVSPVISVKLNETPPCLTSSAEPQPKVGQTPVSSSVDQSVTFSSGSKMEGNTPMKWVIQEGTGSKPQYLIPVSSPSMTADILKAVNQMKSLRHEKEDAQRNAACSSQEKVSPGKDSALVMCNGKVFFVAKKNADCNDVTTNVENNIQHVNAAQPSATVLGSSEFNLVQKPDTEKTVKSDSNNSQKTSDIIDLCCDEDDGSHSFQLTLSSEESDTEEEESNVIFVSYIPPKSGDAGVTEKATAATSQNTCTKNTDKCKVDTGSRSGEVTATDKGCEVTGRGGEVTATDKGGGEVTITDRSGEVTFTDRSCEVTTTDRGSGEVIVTDRGAGEVTITDSSGGVVIVADRGGGEVTITDRSGEVTFTDRSCEVTTTGRGGGEVTITDSTGGAVIVADRGGGEVTITDSTGGAVIVADRGGGEVTITDRGGGAVIVADKGGGEVTITDRSGEVTFTDRSCEVTTTDRGSGEVIVTDRGAGEVTITDRGGGAVIIADRGGGAVTGEVTVTDRSCEVTVTSITDSEIVTNEESEDAKKTIEETSSDQNYRPKSDSELRRMFGLVSDLRISLQKINVFKMSPPQEETKIINKRTLEGIRKLIRHSNIETKIKQLIQKRASSLKPEQDGPLDIKRPRLEENEENNNTPGSSSSSLPNTQQCDVDMQCVSVDQSTDSTTSETHPNSEDDLQSTTAAVEDSKQAPTSPSSTRISESVQPLTAKAPKTNQGCCELRKLLPRQSRGCGRVCTACPCGTKVRIVVVKPQGMHNTSSSSDTRETSRGADTQMEVKLVSEPSSGHGKSEKSRDELVHSNTSSSSKDVEYSSLTVAQSTSQPVSFTGSLAEASTSSTTAPTQHTAGQNKSDVHEITTQEQNMPLKIRQSESYKIPCELFSSVVLDPEEIKRQERIKRLKDLLKQKEAELEKLRRNM